MLLRHLLLVDQASVQEVLLLSALRRGIEVGLEELHRGLPHALFFDTCRGAHFIERSLSEALLLLLDTVGRSDHMLVALHCLQIRCARRHIEQA